MARLDADAMLAQTKTGDRDRGTRCHRARIDHEIEPPSGTVHEPLCLLESAGAKDDARDAAAELDPCAAPHALQDRQRRWLARRDDEAEDEEPRHLRRIGIEIKRGGERLRRQQHHRHGAEQQPFGPEAVTPRVSDAIDFGACHSAKASPSRAQASPSPNAVGGFGFYAPVVSAIPVIRLALKGWQSRLGRPRSHPYEQESFRCARSILPI